MKRAAGYMREPWKCCKCGKIYESLDVPSSACCGQKDGEKLINEYICKECFDKITGEKSKEEIEGLFEN